MKIVPLTAEYKDHWDRIAHNSDDAWLFHLYEWLPLTERIWDLEPKNFLVEHQGKMIGIFPLQIRKRSRNLWSSYMGTGGPALINGLEEGVRKKALRFMHEHVLELSRGYRSPSVEVLLAPLSPSSFRISHSINPLIHHFYEDASTHTWITDLTRSEEEIFSHYADDARRSVKKAQELGYSVSAVDSLAGMEAYYDVHCQTARRTGIEPHPKEYFQEVYKTFCEKGLAVVWGARDPQGNFVAFEITALFKKGALYWMGCCQTDHLDSGVNYLLQHHSMIWAKKQGAQWFENGEAFPHVQHGKLRGLTMFKGKFGGELHRFYKGKIDFTEKSSSGKSFKSWVQAGISLLEPIITPNGVRTLEQSLSFLYSKIKRLAGIKRYFLRIQFLKPYWQWQELCIGLAGGDLSEASARQDLIRTFQENLNIQGALFPVSSGRTALELALKVLKQKYPGKTKVIVPTYGCRGVFDPVVNAGLQPLFSDINKELGLSDEFVGRLLKSNPDVLAIVIPHLCGKAQDIVRLAAMAREHGLIIIEDACQSVGALENQQSLGSQYDMSIFSFGLGKNLSATAGGMLVSRIFAEDLNKEYETLGSEENSVVKRRFIKILLKCFLKWNINLNDEILSAYRYRKMHPLDARLTVVQLKKMEMMIKKQTENARAIIASLRKTNLRFSLQNETGHVYSKLTVIFDDPADCQKLERSLHHGFIETEEMYTPLHLRDFSQGFWSGGHFSVAEKIYRQVFNIPVRPNLKKGELERIIKGIESIETR